MTAARWKLLAAVVVLALGAVVLWRGLGQSLKAAPPPEEPWAAAAEAGSEADAPLAEHPHLIASEEMTFDTRPTAQSVAEVAEDAAERLLDVAPQKLGGESGLETARLYGLADVFERHLAVILAGDYDAWMAFIESTGSEWPSAAGEEGGPPTRERFASAAEAFRLAPLSVGDVTVRALHLGGEEIEHPPFYGGQVSPMVRGPYSPPDPAAARVDVYEVIVPAQASSRRASADGQKVNLGFAYWWSRERSRWVPFSLKFYKDGGATTVSFFF